jgi:hypothetical protein
MATAVVTPTKKRQAAAANSAEKRRRATVASAKKTDQEMVDLVIAKVKANPSWSARILFQMNSGFYDAKGEVEAPDLWNHNVTTFRDLPKAYVLEKLLDYGFTTESLTWLSAQDRYSATHFASVIYSYDEKWQVCSRSIAKTTQRLEERLKTVGDRFKNTLKDLLPAIEAVDLAGQGALDPFRWYCYRFLPEGDDSEVQTYTEIAHVSGVKVWAHRRNRSDVTNGNCGFVEH